MSVEPFNFDRDAMRTHISTLLCGVDDPVRLYPVRIYALDRFRKLDLERGIETVILQPLAAITGPDSWHGPFQLDRAKFGAHKSIPPSPTTGDVTQFISDLGVYGWQEATLFLVDAEYHDDPRAFLQISAALCSDMKNLYTFSQLDLMASDDPDVQKAMMVAAISYGERVPELADPADRGRIAPYLERLASSVYEFFGGSRDEWEGRLARAIGCTPQELESGEYSNEIGRVFGNDTVGIDKLYRKIAG